MKRAARVVLITCVVAVVGVAVPPARAATTNPLLAWTAKHVDLPATAAAYVPLLDKFLVTVSPEHKSLGNELVEVDPTSGELRRHVFVGDHPTNLAVSDDGLVAYVGFHGTNRIARVDLVTFLPTYFPITPTDYGALQVEDLAVVPGRNDLVVASLSDPGSIPRDAGVWAYENGHILPKHTIGRESPTVIELADASTIYGYTQTYSAEDFWKLSLTDEGVSLVKQTTFGLGNRAIKMAGPYLVTDMGEVIDPDTVTIAREFVGVRSWWPGGVAPQPQQDLITFYSGGAVSQYVLSTGTLLASRNVSDFGIAFAKDLVAGRTTFVSLTDTTMYLMGPNLRDDTIHYPRTAPSTLDLMRERLVPVQPTDMVFDVLRNVMYASVAEYANDPHANKVVVIDVASGTVTREIDVGGDPAALALTDDHLTLYVSLRATHEIARISLLTFTEVGRFNVGTVDNGYGEEPVVANDIELAPLSDNRMMVTLTRLSASPSFMAIAVFKDGERLPDMVTQFQGPTLLARDALGRFYGGWGENGVEVTELRMTATGVETASATHGYFFWPMYDFEVNGALGLSGSGTVFDPTSDIRLATLGYQGAFEPLPLLGRVFEMQANFVREYELPEFRQIATRQLTTPLQGYSIERTMISTGPLGLAAITDLGVVLLDFPLVCAGLTVTIRAVDAVTQGTPGDDVIFGTDGPDTIDGGGGNDIICGLGGDDVLIGGDGNDQLIGESGNDRLLGGKGDDVIDGGAGADTVYAGNDAVAHAIDLDDVADDGIVGVEHDNVRPTNEIILGSPGPDRIVGTSGTQFLRGGSGDDILNGGAGDDLLDGAAGADRLYGSSGRDICAVGAGINQLFGCETAV